MSYPNKARRIRSLSGKNIQGDGSRNGGRGNGRFVSAIATALHREFGGTHAAVKTVVRLTGANERAVKNWFEAKNGPSGEHLITLAEHSDDVLEAFLVLAGRKDLVTAKKLVDARNKLQEMLSYLTDLGR
jgi:hypothetical protein